MVGASPLPPSGHGAQPAQLGCFASGLDGDGEHGAESRPMGGGAAQWILMGIFGYTKFHRELI